MANKIQLTPEAQQWAEKGLERYGPPVYAQVASAVLWTDERDASGRLAVPADPAALVDSHRRDPAVLLNGHDPGLPLGQVLEVEAFVTPDGQHFVAGIVGYYGRGGLATFAQLDLADSEVQHRDEAPLVAVDGPIELATDPRDLPNGWLDEVLSDAPPRTVHVQMSYNAANTTHELIRIALAYGILWNPFVKAIATEAGKDVYAAARTWLKTVLDRSRQLESPIICLEGPYRQCRVSFLIRGTNPATHAAAYEGLSEAAAQAATLIDRLEAKGLSVATVVYEFNETSGRWYPSYARLANGRMIVDSPMLIATLQDLPTGLSLGMRKTEMDRSGR
ncbi:hypothetical protein SAMN02800692_0905 [Luteibacter sp. UNC138MFCol5.1]|uniref:hypothetical protein n=1 Tax=Luteibacter sp. UNC138MFCol5.1 TaxID=1502774 RepID=UPI0008C7ED0E|nr:hypothetical protein [Luteibacter sp. UNC138MFCol5.1]SEO46319.1 hypothetical protein SAMN02800692_0905 [Luteibacter sp. UNC138MFCol5.1]